MNQKIRQQENSAESYHENKSNGKLGEMEIIVLEVIREKQPINAKDLVLGLNKYYDQSSVTGAIHRLRYIKPQIKGNKITLPGKRTVTYYSILQPGENSDTPPKSKVDELQGEIESLKIIIKQLRAKNEMLLNNYVTN
jgi:hypothetical protein